MSKVICNDAVHLPPHYTDDIRMECIYVIENVLAERKLSAYEGYLLGNVIKYLYRAGAKGDFHEDLEKAENYLHRLRTDKWIHEEAKDA